jgi:hypothetical protein
MSHSPPRSPSLPKGEWNRLQIPDWAVERLSGLGNSPSARFLEDAVRIARDERKAGHFEQVNQRVVAHKHLRAMWDESIMLPLMRSRNEHHLALRRSLGTFTSADRATDMLARCMPLLVEFEEGTPVRDHLERALSYLEAATAVEAVLVPPARGDTRTRLHESGREWSEALAAQLSEALGALKDAYVAAGTTIRLLPTPKAEERAPLAALGWPGPRPRVLNGARPVPATPPAPPPPVAEPDADAVPVLPVPVVWENHLKAALAEPLKGAHGLRHLATTLARTEDGYAVETTLAREGAEVRVTLSYRTGEPVPSVAHAIGSADGFRPVPIEEIHRTLHEGRDDPASIRLVSEIRRRDPETEGYAIAATGTSTVRISPVVDKVDAARFATILRRIEDLADEAGIKVEAGVDGLVVRVSELLRQGYEWSGRKGETLMTRQPARAPVHAFG